MNEYIFYTAEGETIAPNQNESIENCQILGFIEADDECEAKKLLLQDNPWIIQAGFCPSKIMVKRVFK